MFEDKRTLMQRVVREIRSCNRCGLCHNVCNHVPGEGDPDSKVVFIGEAPGKKEDELGRPFVGAAGKLLDELLEGAGLSRDGVYITNVVKCRPPGNRRPRKSEIEACSSHLDDQILVIRPRMVAPMGNTATGYILEKYSLRGGQIGDLHGKKFEVKANWGEIIVYPLYHPAAAIYNRGLLPKLKADVEELEKLLS